MNQRRKKSADINFRDAIATIIGREADLDQGLITVTQVDVSPDFSSVKVFVSVLPEGNEGKVLRWLKGTAREIASQLAGAVKIKYIPKMTFLGDRGHKNYTQVEQILERLHDQEKEIPRENEETGGTSEGGQENSPLNP